MRLYMSSIYASFYSDRGSCRAIKGLAPCGIHCFMFVIASCHVARISEASLTVPMSEYHEPRARGSESQFFWPLFPAFPHQTNTPNNNTKSHGCHRGGCR